MEREEGRGRVPCEDFNALSGIFMACFCSFRSQCQGAMKYTSHLSHLHLPGCPLLHAAHGWMTVCMHVWVNAKWPHKDRRIKSLVGYFVQFISIYSISTFDLKLFDLRWGLWFSPTVICLMHVWQNRYTYIFNHYSRLHSPGNSLSVSFPFPSYYVHFFTTVNVYWALRAESRWPHSILCRQVLRFPDLAVRKAVNELVCLWMKSFCPKCLYQFQKASSFFFFFLHAFWPLYAWPIAAWSEHAYQIVEII